ncbi:chromosome segregation protein SMC [Aquicella lusitana]|uniref:Chromosome partition protein Smc n=1 Tax=Aquicella lusitana TaxID=254246 RepID=A0A370GQR9_9COXI|nr:chromosome segregation protein SMC [Aquicella lusitana]RDI46027.1 condensin subunit Smc [Aquicella lusitana]VVC73376.1 Chromosome partition protein Smc [Aquicella lusitana]
MQLSKIKIAGFKSFVDPTVISLPSKLVAIVGPNGCGKSNIIDAVTWVMGESSPKYLRGESLTDVIFNGSSSRKPVGQASVELIFDNSDGAIGGEYAKFAEISVKRVINRESDSTYYLNGVRCRKRDVVDLFLGTGLGPRSYSIIGQNMISRIIEAKPDELRTYLEEAAGISKYKERRHETELRIHHTKENLARINDLRAELEKQLSHLKHQANVAEKFKVLKQQERVLRAQLYGVQWRQLDSRMVEHTLQIQREETALEARHSELSGTDREIEQMRHEQRAAHDAFQEVQRRYYAVGNEITRIEQDILHHQERQQQWEHDLKQTESDWQTVKDQMAESEDNLREIEQDIHRIEPELAAIKDEMVHLQGSLEAAEEEMQTWQTRWDEFNQVSAKTTQTAQVEKTHIQHLEQKIAFLQKRQEQLQQDQHRLNFSELTKEIEEFTKKAYEVTDALEFQNKQLADVRKEISTLQSTQQDSNTSLDNVRSELQKLRGQQASLEALQQTALGQRGNPAASWAAKHQLGSKPRLAQNIEVESGWEFAVEKVLGFCLQAICVDQVSEIAPHVEDLKKGNICVFTPVQPASPGKENSTKGTALLQKVKSPWSLDSLIGGIYVADSMDEALALCESLDVNESVITRDGVWLNRSWLKILREEDPAAGVFQREQELKKLAARISQLQETQKELEKNINDRRETIQKLEQQRDQLQQSCNQKQAQAAQFNTQQKMKQERLAELKSQSERYVKELLECTDQLKKADAELVQARSLWQQAMSELEQHAAAREGLIKERDKARLQLQSMREQNNAKKELMHELEIRLQTSRSQKASLHQAVGRLQGQLTTLNERKITLQSELTSMPPLDSIKKSLSRALDKHVSVEVELNTARVAVESLDQEFRHLEEKRQIIERDINKIRTSLESLRVQWQGWKVKADTLVEQLKETEFTLEDTLKDLPQELTTEDCQTKLDQLVQRINRLGPINLVAIDEYATCLERKQYLDKQLEDLQAGLATLEDAIAKIDRETRTRFKETFDKVNGRFQELFPTVFGGGKAYLELNSDNLLEAGVTMMACPPGKRNSSIYLLSGGEKSLTAIALIFSIFHLNPAPFCLLDEVDAALDDANVLRFTRLVKTMTERTQFLFISHNKITIEMAEHLIGVTMNEPGVSRLVSVDIEKAMSLAGT